MHGHHRYVVSPFKFEDRSEFDPRKILYYIQNGFLVDIASRHVRVALFTRQHDQTIGPDLAPKGLVVHRLQPVFNIVDVFEFHDEISIARPLTETQTSSIHEGRA